MHVSAWKTKSSRYKKTFRNLWKKTNSFMNETLTYHILLLIWFDLMICVLIYATKETL